MYNSLVYYCIPAGDSLYIFPFHVHIYIRASGPQINTSVIPNKGHARLHGNSCFHTVRILAGED
jgi:hypothetical protein